MKPKKDNELNLADIFSKKGYEENPPNEELEDFTPYHETEPDEKPFIEMSKLAEENAYHEASHLVFQCMTLNCLNGFLPIKYIIVCAEEERKNKVAGIVPNVNDNDKEIILCNGVRYKMSSNFFKKDRKRVAAKMMSLIAGYSSYQIFMEDNKYYIEDKAGKSETDTSDFIVKHYRNEDSLLTIAKKYYRREAILLPNVSDFNKLFMMLEDYYELTLDDNIDGVNEAIDYLTKVAQDLMKVDGVNKSIRYVKEYLVDNQRKEIEGTELSNIIEKVNKLTKTIPFERHLVELNKTLMSLKEKYSD